MLFITGIVDATNLGVACCGHFYADVFKVPTSRVIVKVYGFYVRVMQSPPHNKKLRASGI